MDPNTRLQIDIRLQEALEAAGRSALGMPATVETFRAWLAQARLELALADAPAQSKH